MTRVYVKNGFIQCRELREQQVTTAGGIILLGDALKMSDTGHEVEVVASATDDLKPGDRVIISVRGISAFHKVDGEDRFSIPEAEVWAKVVDGEVFPRHEQILTERDDAAFKRYVLGESSLILPESLHAYGQSAGDIDDPQQGGSRNRDCVTLLYERVRRVGPDVKDQDFRVGGLVAFSPSYCSTRLQWEHRSAKGTSYRHLHLIHASEVFFCVDE